MEETVKLVYGYKRRALEEIKSARLLADSHLHAGAVSRAYYACFYAINYLLIQDGIDAKTHKQVAVEFRKKYIKTGLLDKKLSQILDQLFNTRMLSDYDAIIDLEPKRVTHLISLAETFVLEVIKIK